MKLPIVVDPLLPPGAFYLTSETEAEAKARIEATLAAFRLLSEVLAPNFSSEATARAYEEHMGRRGSR